MKIKKIEYDVQRDDLTIWIEGSDEPWSEREFVKGSTNAILTRWLKSTVRDMIKVWQIKTSGS